MSGNAEHDGISRAISPQAKGERTAASLLVKLL